MSRTGIAPFKLQNIRGLFLLLAIAPPGLAQLSMSTSSGHTAQLGVPPDDGTLEIQLTATENWVANVDSNWLRLEPSAGGPGTSKLRLTYDCNPSVSSRTAQVRIGNSRLSLTQAAGSVCPWRVHEEPQYSISYGEEFAQDVDFVRSIMERGLAIMREKYGVEKLPFPVKIFLHTRPNSSADQNTARTTVRGEGLPVWIDYLSPSAPEWKTAGMSSFGQEKNSPLYHRQTIIHEFAHVIQMAISSSYYFYPSWVYEGLAHYEGVFNSSEENRAAAREHVAKWIKGNPQVVVCCRTLGPEAIAVTDVYNGGTFFWYAMAEAYGEDLHRRVLAHPSRNISAVLTAETGASLEEIHAAVREIFEKFTADIRNVALPMEAITVGAAAGSVPLTWTAVGPWEAATSAPWLKFPLSRGYGGSYGGYLLSWEANPYCSARTATLTIGDAVLTVTQQGAKPPCLPGPPAP